MSEDLGHAAAVQIESPESVNELPGRHVLYRYCRETGIEPPVDMVAFAMWCETHSPLMAVEVEKMAARVFNGGMTESGAANSRPSRDPNLNGA